MSRTAYPTDSDVTNLLANAGLPALSNFGVPGFSAAGYAAAAIDGWERRTGYVPFLNTGEATSRVYDPPGPNHRPTLLGSLLGGGRTLELDCGLFSLTSVTVGVDVDSPGAALTEGVDFWLRPANAVAENSPYERVFFRAPVFGPPNSVVVVGGFGWGAAIPEDAWQGILRLAASLAVDDIREGLSASPVKWQEDKVGQEWSPSSIANLGAGYQRQGEAALARYRRVCR